MPFLIIDNLAGLVITETGLPGVLFTMLDTETDPSLIKHIHDTLTSMLQVLAADNLSQWLSLCKSVLTVANGKSICKIIAIKVQSTVHSKLRIN